MIRSVLGPGAGGSTADDLTLATDARDILAARDSLKQLLGLSQLDT